MAKRNPSPLRLLLVQARNTAAMEVQEQICFQERCRLEASHFVPFNVARAHPHRTLIDDADALLIGGAGEYSVTRDYPWMPALLDLVRAANERSLPTFGSCWGHQLIARALGGTVVHDSERAELGCHPVELTPAGREDPLFGSFPHRFLANMGHHDRVAELPPGGVELAFSDTQPHQAFRIDGKPIYGTQFHSELDATRERERLLAYRSYYEELASEEAFQDILSCLAETTEVDHLLHDFVEKIVLEENPDFEF